MAGRALAAVAAVGVAGAGAAACRSAPSPASDAGMPAFAEVCGPLEDAILGAWALPSGDAWLVGGVEFLPRAFVLHYDGNAFTSFAFSGVGPFRAVWAENPADVWLAGDRFIGDRVSFAHWDGSVWGWTCAPGAGDVHDLWGSGSDAVWAVGATLVPAGDPPGALLLYWNGTEWLDEATTIGGSRALHGVWGAAADDVWAVGDAGTILRYDGSTWSVVASPLTVPLFAVHGSATDDVWAVGGDQGDGALLHFDGQAWSVADTPAEAILRDVWVEPGSSTAVVGDHGLAARYSSPGAAADVLDTGTVRPFTSVAADGAGLWAGGGDPRSVSAARGFVERLGMVPAGCPPEPAPVDAGECAAPPPSCPVAPGSAGAGEACATGRDCECASDLTCVYASCYGEVQCAASHFVCTTPCANDAQCAADFGTGACCARLVLYEVTEYCHPADWPEPGGDVCP